ncbi:MAG: indolepyruvate oxidoreductase subunit beta [Methanospirillum sp.]|mgnify:CR=1 FL=1|nr:indolepyruvate oxidoreductase subunit beta [Methanospirillum sp.]
MSFDVMIVGVGGQGTILASNILGMACVEEGRPVRGAETHGMAQRGGSVECSVRIDGEFGPLVDPGTADLLLSFDLLEALRYRHFLRPSARVVTNTAIITPTPVFTQELSLPSPGECLERLAPFGPIALDAGALAREAGSELALNVVLIGAASHLLPLAPESLLAAIERSVPPKTVGVNRRAFALGREAAVRNRQGDGVVPPKSS